jgi:hypothetical protein
LLQTALLLKTWKTTRYAGAPAKFKRRSNQKGSFHITFRVDPEMVFNWIILTILIIAGGFLSQAQHQDEVSADAATVDTLSRSMLVYRSAAAEYARNNPAFAGVPADSALSLPNWYSKPAGVTSYLSGGSAYTYYTGATPAGCLQPWSTEPRLRL